MGVEVERCPGCGSILAKHDGPTHDYMSSSPACWAAFGEVLAREYANPALMDVHRLTVDTWAVQHPGDGSRRAIQSVGMHLCRIKLQLELGYAGLRANDAMRKLTTLKSQLPLLPQPANFKVTIADVRDAIAPEAHEAAILHWARSTWEDWSAQHAFVAHYLAEVGLAEP